MGLVSVCGLKFQGEWIITTTVRSECALFLPASGEFFIFDVGCLPVWPLHGCHLTRTIRLNEITIRRGFYLGSTALVALSQTNRKCQMLP